MAAPQPEDWLKEYAKVQKVADREILRLLTLGLRDLNRDLAAIEQSSKRLGVGEQVRREQLQLIKRALLKRQAEVLRGTGEVTEARRSEAAARAVKLSGSIDALLFGAAGAKDIASELTRSLTEGMSRTLDTVIARVTKSAIPLSQKVYRTEVWMEGRIQNLVNSALLRGLSARDFAREARAWINPNVKGGVRYAAMRLARTEINNAYHAATVVSNSEKPWVTSMRWRLSGSHPKRPGPPEVCERYANNDHDGLGAGVFAKGNVPPKPHPQCLCTVLPEVNSSDDFENAFLGGEYDQFLSAKVPGYADLKRKAAEREAKKSAPKRKAPPKAKKPAAPVTPADDKPPFTVTFAPEPKRAPVIEIVTTQTMTIPPLARSRIVQLVSGGSRLANIAAIIARQNNISTKQAESWIREIAVQFPGKPASRELGIYAGNTPAPAPATVEALKAVVKPSTAPAGRTKLPSKITARLRQHLRSINNLEGDDAELIQEEMEFQATLVPKTAAGLKRVTYSDKTNIEGSDAISLAYYDNASEGIFLNPAVFRPDFHQKMKMAERLGQKTRCGHGHHGAQSTFAHEFGHHIHRVFRFRSPAARVDIAKALGMRPPERGEPLKEWFSSQKTWIEANVSKYAATSEQELMAEVWREFSTDPNASPHIKAAGKIMRKIAEEYS